MNEQLRQLLRDPNDNFMIGSFVDPLSTSVAFKEAMLEDWGRNGKVVEFTPIVWHRANASNGGGNRFTHAFELFILCFVGGRNQVGTWNRELFSSGSQGRHNVIDLPELPYNQKYKVSAFDTEPLNTMQKPVSFYWWLLSLLCQETDNVLSICSGSGSMAAAAMIFGCNCDSIDIDQNQTNGALIRIRNLKQEEALGGWSNYIEPAIIQLEALRFSRSWTGAKAIEDWITRSSKGRMNLGSRISEGKNVFCGLATCKEKILVAKDAFVCGNESCDQWLHKNCKDFVVNKILACCKQCQDVILGKAAPRPADASTSSSSMEAGEEGVWASAGTLGASAEASSP